MSNFSNNTPVNAPKAVFKKHYPYENATSLTESKYIADDYSNTHRYQHRAEVMIVGNATLRPYDPNYLDGLPNGMSGYWTVLSIQHVFGGSPARYLLYLEVGTDVIGDVNPNAAMQSDTRDIQNDLANQSLVASDTGLTTYSLSPNSSAINTNNGVTPTTARTNTTSVSIPAVAGATAFKDKAPNLTGVKKTVQWTSKTSGKVVK